MTTNETNPTIKIEAELFAQFAEKWLVKQNRKAKKLGLPSISATVVKTTTVREFTNKHGGTAKLVGDETSTTLTGYFGAKVVFTLNGRRLETTATTPTGDCYDEYVQTRVYDVLDVVLEGATPKLEGFEFLARITHEEAGNLLLAVEGFDVPEHYRTSAAWCDHCQSQRRRRDTFLVRATEGGEILEVGSSCLGDFLGRRDAESVLQFYAGLVDAENDLDAFCEASYAKVDRRLDTEEFLGYVAAEIRTNGWMSAGAAKKINDGRGEDERTVDSTASFVVYLMNTIAAPRKSRFELEMIAKWMNASGGVQDRDIERVKAAREWIANTNCYNDFLHNLSVAVGSAKIPSKATGIAAALFVAYDKAMERETERKQLRAKQDAEWTNEHVGTVGDRLEIGGEIVKVKSVESAFGTSRMIQIRDEQGRQIVWWATGRAADGLSKGDKVSGKATVKKHGAYNGIAQTTVSRAALAVVEAAEAE